ncbi:MAG TPA: hypothetical protein VD794_09685 [Flavisolibacter sp.]|nr:hypothetical protein [Flavisolibacter sp.]
MKYFLELENAKGKAVLVDAESITSIQQNDMNANLSEITLRGSATIVVNKPYYALLAKLEDLKVAQYIKVAS